MDIENIWKKWNIDLYLDWFKLKYKVQGYQVI